AEREEREAEHAAQRLNREREAARNEQERERERAAQREERERAPAAQREAQEPERHARHNGRNGQQGRVIKGHISANGEKIYHLPGQSSYERTQANETFHSEEAAQAAGFRRAETPGGGHIKGHIGSGGEK